MHKRIRVESDGGDAAAAGAASPVCLSGPGGRAGRHDPGDNRLREPLQAVFAAVPSAWRGVTEAFLQSATGRSLAEFVDGRVRSGAVVYPRQVLHALDYCPPEAVRVVILGQDPYHRPGQAQGLAFSVPTGQRPWPPSLRNMLVEVAADLGRPSASGGDLRHWARQGVLLLNAVLTVEQGAPQSHAGKGWESLTDALVAHVAARGQPVVFLLWGGAAQRKRQLLDDIGRRAHAVLTANHPSPLSARRGAVPFIGCRHFSAANRFLAVQRRDAGEVDW